jgi:hypothetical protein
VTIALLLISDGRDEYLQRTRTSLVEMLPRFDHVIHVDDREHRLGFAGAIQEGWRQVLETDARYVFHLEQDFTFNRPVDVAGMATVLQARPHLAQLALRRQPWNDAERAAGGIVEQHPDDYVERSLGPYRWLEHRRFFTTNPCLYRTWICRQGWPDGADSEGRFGIRLLETKPEARFGYWGARDSGEAVTHIGEHRAGNGY